MKLKFLTSKPVILIIIAGLIYVGFLHYQIIRHGQMPSSEQADYLIILGARVKGTVPSLSLQARIDTAAHYLKKYENTIVIASGGMGPGEDISEAEAIKRELIDQGIAQSRILLEDRSTDTYENIKFSKKLLPDSAKSGLLVTNDFHIFRSKMIAEDEGLQMIGLPAKTPAQAVAKSYFREYLALTKYYLKRFL